MSLHYTVDIIMCLILPYSCQNLKNHYSIHYYMQSEDQEIIELGKTIVHALEDYLKKHPNEELELIGLLETIKLDFYEYCDKKQA